MEEQARELRELMESFEKDKKEDREMEQSRYDGENWYPEYARASKRRPVEEYVETLKRYMLGYGCSSLIAGLTFRCGDIFEEARKLEEFLFYATGNRNLYEFENEVRDYGTGSFEYFSKEFRTAKECLCEQLEEEVEDNE